MLRSECSSVDSPHRPLQKTGVFASCLVTEERRQFVRFPAVPVLIPASWAVLPTARNVVLWSFGGGLLAVIHHDVLILEYGVATYL